jgi:hypothetical protein
MHAITRSSAVTICATGTPPSTTSPGRFAIAATLPARPARSENPSRLRRRRSMFRSATRRAAESFAESADRSSLIRLRRCSACSICLLRRPIVRGLASASAVAVACFKPSCVRSSSTACRSATRRLTLETSVSIAFASAVTRSCSSRWRARSRSRPSTSSSARCATRSCSARISASIWARCASATAISASMVAVSSVATTWPACTRSPTLTRTALTRPGSTGATICDVVCANPST